MPRTLHYRSSTFICGCFLLRNRIIAPFGKGMATGDAAQGQSEGECKGVVAEGFRGRSTEALVGALWGLIVQNEFEGLAFQVCNSAFEVSNMHLNIACDETCAPDVVALRVATALFAADLLLEIVKGHLLDGLSRHGQGNGQRTGTDINACKNGLKFRQRGFL